MAGQLGQRKRVAGRAGGALEISCLAEVELAPLEWQQVLIGGLAQQGVAEVKRLT